MTVFTTQWACRNRAISDTSAETNGRAAGATSAGFMSGILSTQVSLFPPGANGCRFHSRASGAAICASARAALGVAWGARRKPGPASPANMSKRGLSARHSVPNQTLSLVNFRLPKGNPTAGNRGRPGGYGGSGSGFHARGGGARLVASPFETAAPRPPSLRACSPVGWVERSDTHQRSARSARWVSLRSTHPDDGYDFAFSRRYCARGLLITSSALFESEGAGKTGCLLHPRSRVRFAQTKLHTSIQGSGSIPAFPAQWLYGLLRALPGERLSCHRRLREASLLRT